MNNAAMLIKEIYFKNTMYTADFAKTTWQKCEMGTNNRCTIVKKFSSGG